MLERKGPMASVTDKAWDGSPGRFTDEQYRRSCLLDRGADYSESVKQRYGLPVLEPDGTINKAAVSAAASRISSVSGASTEQKQSAKRKLRAMYKKIDEDPPDAVKETAYQTPFDETEVVDLGPKLWRKQILPYRSINYKGGALNITKEMAKKIVENHKKRPFETTPFVIGHTDNPEAGRGEILGMSLASDGVEAILQTNDAGTQMIENNGGKLPVSVRLLEDYTRESDNEHFGPVVQHVAATYSPRMTNMRPWEAVEAGEQQESVVDLSEEAYEVLAPPVAPPASEAESVGGLSAEDQAVMDRAGEEIADDEASEGTNENDESENDESENDVKDNENTPKQGEKVTFKRGGETWTGEYLRMEGDNAIIDVDGEEVKVPAAMLQKKANETEEKEGDTNMSEETVDMAELERSRYETRIAELEAREHTNTLELRRQRVERELEEYGRAGVPPVDLDAARPLLMDDEAAGEIAYTDLSEDGAQEKKSARGDLVRKLLDARKGTIEFGEKGDAAADLSEDDAQMNRIKAYATEHELPFNEAARYVS